MTGISIIVAFVLFLFLFISIRNKDCKQFTSIFILLLLLYDWIFICIGYALPSQIVLILKSFCELDLSPSSTNKFVSSNINLFPPYNIIILSNICHCLDIYARSLSLLLRFLRPYSDCRSNRTLSYNLD